MLELWFDGLFRGTQVARKAGLMCFGWLILRENQQIAKGYGIAARGMNATSNIAEYLGLIDGLEALVDISVNDEPVRVIGDSKVVINRMQGLSRINARQVASLHHRACCLAQLLHMVDWKWVPRKYNKAADQLTRHALREFRSNPLEVRQAWKTVLSDHTLQRDQLHILGGMMVYQGYPAL
jgi:ribonuclease HI